MEQAGNDRTYIQEIEAALADDDRRLGDVFQARQEDPDKEAKVIATELGLSTPGTVYANLRAMETMRENRVRSPIKPTSAKQAESLIRGFAKRHSSILSVRTRERLHDLVLELQRIIVDENAINQENEELEREDLKRQAEASDGKGVPGIYVYTFPHYLRFPILDADAAETDPRTFLKVGRSENMLGRIEGQTRTYMPEPPLILRMYAVPKDELREAEGRLHNHLRAAGHGRLHKKGAGKEWFLTQLAFLDSTSDLMGLTPYWMHEDY